MPDNQNAKAQIINDKNGYVWTSNRLSIILMGENPDNLDGGRVNTAENVKTVNKYYAAITFAEEGNSLTIGGINNPSGSDYNISYTGDNLQNDLAAVRFAAGGSIAFSSHTGASRANLNSDGGPEKSDSDIHIGAFSSMKTSDVVSLTVSNGTKDVVIYINPSADATPAERYIAQGEDGNWYYVTRSMTATGVYSYAFSANQVSAAEQIPKQVQTTAPDGKSYGVYYGDGIYYCTDEKGENYQLYRILGADGKYTYIIGSTLTSVPSLSDSTVVYDLQDAVDVGSFYEGAVIKNNSVISGIEAKDYLSINGDFAGTLSVGILDSRTGYLNEFNGWRVSPEEEKALVTSQNASVENVAEVYGVKVGERVESTGSGSQEGDAEDLVTSGDVTIGNSFTAEMTVVNKTRIESPEKLEILDNTLSSYGVYAGNSIYLKSGKWDGTVKVVNDQNLLQQNSDLLLAKELGNRTDPDRAHYSYEGTFDSARKENSMPTLFSDSTDTYNVYINALNADGTVKDFYIAWINPITGVEDPSKKFLFANTAANTSVTGLVFTQDFSEWLKAPTGNESGAIFKVGANVGSVELNYTHTDQWANNTNGVTSTLSGNHIYSAGLDAGSDIYIDALTGEISASSSDTGLLAEAMRSTLQLLYYSKKIDVSKFERYDGQDPTSFTTFEASMSELENLQNMVTSAEAADRKDNPEVLTIEISGNTLEAKSIVGKNVTINDFTGKLNAAVNGNLLDAVFRTEDGYLPYTTEQTVTENKFYAVGIEAETLSLGLFNGEIYVEVKDNDFLAQTGESYSVDGILTGTLIGSDDMRGTITMEISDNLLGVTVSEEEEEEGSTTVSRVYATGIYVKGDMTLTGKLGTNITITNDNPDDLGVSVPYASDDFIVAVKLSPGSDSEAAGILTAEAFTGEITLRNSAVAGISAPTAGFSVYGFDTHTASQNFTASEYAGYSIRGDAFDFTGSITAKYGIVSVGALNIRVSGTIDSAGSIAIESEHSVEYAQQWHGEYNNVVENDYVEIASGAVVNGSINLYKGENTLVISSGASIQGNIYATGSTGTNLIFMLEGAATGQAIVQTLGYYGFSPDLTLTSAATISFNLNNAATGTYDIYSYSGSYTQSWASSWSGKDFACFYKGQTLSIRLGQTITFQDGEYTVKATLQTDGNVNGAGSVQLVVDRDAGAVLDAFDAGYASGGFETTTEINREDRTATLTWSAPKRADGTYCYEQLNASGALELDRTFYYELEYWITDKDGVKGKSITVKLDAIDQVIRDDHDNETAREKSFVITGLSEGEKVEWRVRWVTDDGKNMSAWTTLDSETNPTGALDADIVMNSNTPKVSDVLTGSGGVTSAFAKMQWDSATTENYNLKNYTVQYFTRTSAVEQEFKAVVNEDGEVIGLYSSDQTYGDQSGTQVDINSAALLDKVISFMFENNVYSALYTKTVTATEAIASGLQDGNNVYWRVRANDDGGNSSTYVNGETFRVSVGDETAPEFKNEKSSDLTPELVYTVRRTYMRETDTGSLVETYYETPEMDITLYWNRTKADSQSGLRYYLIELQKQEYNEEGELIPSDSWQQYQVMEYEMTSTREGYAYQWSISGLEGGLYKYRISAVDHAGNVSEPYTNIVTVHEPLNGDPLIVNANGEFGSSDVTAPEGGTITFAQAKPDVVKDDTGAITGVSLTLNWTPSEDILDESGIIYKVYISTSAEFPSDSTITVLSDLDTTSITLNNTAGDRNIGWLFQQNTRNFYYKVQALDKYGNTNDSLMAGDPRPIDFSDAGKTLSDDSAPTQATGLAASLETLDADGNLKKDIVTFRWNPASDALSGVKEYDIYLAEGIGDNVVYSLYATVNATESMAYTLPTKSFAEGSYSWYVVAKDACYISAEDSPNNFSTSDIATFSIDVTAPGYLGSDVQSSPLHIVGDIVYWNMGTDANGIREYVLEYKASSSSKWITVTLDDLDSTSAKISNLKNGQKYDFRLTMYDNADTKSITGESNSKQYVLNNQTLSIPTSRTYIKLDGWTNDPNALYYELVYSITNADGTISEATKVKVYSLEYYLNDPDNIKPGSVVNYQVKSVIGGSDAAPVYGTTDEVRTAVYIDDLTPPELTRYDDTGSYFAVSSELKITGDEKKQNITIKWKPATDTQLDEEGNTISGSGVSKYVLQYKLADGKTWEEISSDAILGSITINHDITKQEYSYTFTNLPIGSYDYRITVYDNAGNSSEALSTESVGIPFIGDLTGDFTEHSFTVTPTFATSEDGTNTAITSATIEVSWTDTISSDTKLRYQLTFSDNPEFSSTLGKVFSVSTDLVQGGGSSVTFNNELYYASGLFSGMDKVYWKVTPVDEFGVVGLAGEVWDYSFLEDENVGMKIQDNVRPTLPESESLTFVNLKTGKVVGDYVFEEDFEYGEGFVASTGYNANFVWNNATDDFGIIGFNLTLTSTDGLNKDLSGTYWLPVTQDSGDLSGNHLEAQAFLKDGKYQWTISAVDGAGNETAYKQKGTFTMDTVAPIWADGDSGLRVDADGKYVILNWNTAADTYGVDYYNIYYREKGSSSGEWKSFLSKWTSTSYFGTQEKDGTYEFLVTAVDKEGNEMQKDATKAVTGTVNAANDLPDAYLNASTVVDTRSTPSAGKDDYSGTDYWEWDNAQDTAVGLDDKADSIHVHVEAESSLVLRFTDVESIYGKGTTITVKCYGAGYTSPLATYRLSGDQSISLTLYNSSTAYNVKDYYFEITSTVTTAAMSYQLDLQLKDMGALTSGGSPDAKPIADNDNGLVFDVQRSLAGGASPTDRYDFSTDDDGRYTLILEDLTARVRLDVYRASDDRRLKTLTISPSQLADGTFKNSSGKIADMILDQGDYYYTVTVIDAAKGVSTNYKATLYGEAFTKADEDTSADPGRKIDEPLNFVALDGDANAKSAVISSDGWVGYGDNADYLSFRVDESGEYDFRISDVENTLSFKLMNLDTGRAVRSISATSSQKNGENVSSAVTGVYELEAGVNYQLVVTASGASSAKNSSYKITATKHEDDLNGTLDAAQSLAETDPDSNGGFLTKYNWVGLNDNIDYFKIIPDATGTYDFEISGLTNAVTLSVVTIGPNSRGVDVETVLKKVTVTPAYTSSTMTWKSSGLLEGVLLDKDQTYYVKVQATGATSNRNTYYNLKMTSESFESHLTNDDYVLSEKGVATFAMEKARDISDKGATDILVTGDEAWVGYGDTLDAYKIQLQEGDGVYNITVSGITNRAVVRIYDENGKQKAATTVAGTEASPRSAYFGFNTLLDTADAPTTYYITVESSYASRGLNTSYEIDVEKILTPDAGTAGNWDDATTSTSYVQDNKIVVDSSKEGVTQLAENEYIGNNDTVDIRQLEITQAGNYRFALDGLSNTAKLVIFQQVSSTSRKNYASVSATPRFNATTGEWTYDTLFTNELYLEAGIYYIEVSAAATKTTNYDLYMQAEFSNYTKFDGQDVRNKNNWANNVLGATNDKEFIQVTLDGSKQDLGETWLTRPSSDNNSKEVEWVGDADKVDYYQVNVETKGSYNFILSDLTNAVKMTIYKENGTTALKSVTVTPKLDAATGDWTVSGGGISNYIMEAGTYYVKVEATGAASHKNTFYHLSVDGDVFCNQNSADNTYKTATYVTYNTSVNPIDGKPTEQYGTLVYGEWVGYGDSIDYFAFSVDSSSKDGKMTAGVYTFSFGDNPNLVNENALFYIYRKVVSSSGTESSPVQIGTFNGAKADSLTLTLLDGDYYIAVKSADSGRGVKNTTYDIKVEESETSRYAILSASQVEKPGESDTLVWEVGDDAKFEIAAGETFMAAFHIGDEALELDLSNFEGLLENTTMTLYKNVNNKLTAVNLTDWALTEVTADTTYYLQFRNSSAVDVAFDGTQDDEKKWTSTLAS